MNGSKVPRVAVASIVQETNTFSPVPSTMADFAAHGLWSGAEAADRSRGTNTEIAGALEALSASGAEPVPVLRAWAMSGGTLDRAAFITLRDMLLAGLRAAGPLDGVVLCLHGALVAEHDPAADAALVEETRSLLGASVPVVVTHDLHANVTERIVAAATALIGFRTYPHVDQADTGRRGARLLLDGLRGGPEPATVLAKRAMLVPAEAQALADPPMARLRGLADSGLGPDVVDVSLFPVQPWLDVPELGFGVTVTTTGDVGAARRLAERIADAAWADRSAFDVELHDPAAAIDAARAAGGTTLLVQSADSPTSGATADSAAVIGALLTGGQGLSAIATVVDAPVVAACVAAGEGGRVRTTLGATLDPRWSEPVPVDGRVVRLGSEPVVLTGESMTGQEVSLGRWATLDTGHGLTVLVTERPAPTFDPAGFRHAGLEPGAMDVVVVRSATMYRASYRGLYSAAYVLDLPGASTPRFGYLDYRRAPAGLYPVAEPPQPLVLGDNRVPVYYAGGAGITAFRGGDGTVTGPEDWVASVTALPAGLLPPGAAADTGVSQTERGSLRDVIAADPAGWLGRPLASAFGGEPGLLVKLLDAGQRLPVHCHPGREFARSHLGCAFGKTEGWIVMDAVRGARVWLGMRDAVDRADLRAWIERGDTPAMLAAMNELAVHPGQVIYVPAGVPHAIGPGVMVTELQEPTSFSVLADHAAFGVDGDAATLGLGWDLALSCFDLSARGPRLADLVPAPRPVAPGPGSAGGDLWDLFPPGSEEFFRAWRAECTGALTLPEAGFAVLVVTGGRGRLLWSGGGLAVRHGETLVVPAGVGPLTLHGDLRVLVCRPPVV